MVALPTKYIGPGRLLIKRVFVALGVLGLTTLIVYFDRGGYGDSSGGELSLLDSLYYSTVTLSTTGYGDIVPVSPLARTLSVILVTPLRLLFLLVLVGTTLEVLTTTARSQARSERWRKKVRDHTVIIGYGTKGRSALLALCDAGTPPSHVVVVDPDAELIKQANSDGAAAIHGDGTLRRVLEQAHVERADRIVVATNRDDTSVLATLTARKLNPRATIVVAVREAENESLLRTAGANSVVVYAETAGRLLGVSAMSQATGDIAHDLLSVGSGLELVEREAQTPDYGREIPHDREILLAVVRDGKTFRYGDSTVVVAPGDGLVVVRKAELEDVIPKMKPDHLPKAKRETKHRTHPEDFTPRVQAEIPRMKPESSAQRPETGQTDGQI